MDEANDLLGELLPLYQEYLDLVNNIEPGPDLERNWHPQVAQDRFAALTKNLTPETTAEDLFAIQEKARHYYVKRRDVNLQDAHFVGSICLFFEQVSTVDNLELLSKEEVTNIDATAQYYLKVPENKRKGAKLTADLSGYYWGGKLYRFV